MDFGYFIGSRNCLWYLQVSSKEETKGENMKTEVEKTIGEYALIISKGVTLGVLTFLAMVWLNIKFGVLR